MSRIAFLSAFLLASSILAAPPYPYRQDRLPTVRLERHEWANIVAIGRTEIGDEPLKAAFRAALGNERANRYIEDQEGEPFTKQDTHALVRELYPLIPGAVEADPALATREDKTDWIIAQARRCFVKVETGVAVPDDARIAQVIHYALDRVEEFELAGGTLEKFPDPPPDPEVPKTITGQETGFLWKPIGDNSKKLRVLLPPQFTGLVNLNSVELWHAGSKIETLAAIGPGNPIAGGPREHFAGDKQGGAYAAGVQVRASAEAVTWVWTVNKPSGRAENLKAAPVSEQVEQPQEPTPTPEQFSDSDRIKAGENK